MDIKRVALYIRVSTEEQVREGYSLDAQKKHLLEYAKKHNYTVVDIYADEGITARKSYHKRKAFMRLLSDIEANKIDLVLFIKLDRWFRSVSDYHKVQEILDKHRVGWKATTEQYDTTTAGGRLYINIRLAVAQDEADRTGERIKFVQDRKIVEGEIINGSIPKGYKVENKKLVIDEEEAEKIRFIFNTYLTLRSISATASKVSTVYGTSFSIYSLKGILKNQKYIGKCRSNNAYCPPIIDLATFNEAQNILKIGSIRFASYNRNYAYLFSKLLFCPICDSHLIGRGVSNIKRKHRTYSYRYYLCPKNKNYKQCFFGSKVSEKKLEQFLINNLLSEVKKYKINYELNHKKINDISKNKKIIEGKLARLRELFINELIDLKDYKKEYDTLKASLEHLENQELEKPTDFSKLESLLHSNFQTMYNALDNEGKRALWYSIIKKIVVNQDKTFTIFFK